MTFGPEFLADFLTQQNRVSQYQVSTTAKLSHLISVTR